MRLIKSVAAVAIAFITIAIGSPSAHAAPVVELLTTSGCACCELWANRMHKAGFVVEIKHLGMGQLVQAKLKAGVPIQLSACHTAKVGGYVIEGHVPPADVLRLLSEKSEAKGLIVKGMPIGSPGMESGSRREAYDVLLLQADGTWKTYVSYSALP
ncbi:MAG: hypothetical protein APF80_17545 [Alphaproteobacteria bacterium BRH_c36]|nr:MAG: hypothetical protein APF80_17545 [Alphaproteobacteria bacterium BRH_c36]